MPIVLAVVLCGMAAALVTGRLAPGLTARAPVRITNYRGLEVSTGIGIAAIAGSIAALAVLSLMPVASELSPVARASLTWPVIVALAGFGLLGAWDDLAGGRARPGERARRFDPSQGGMRAVAGIAIALVAVPPTSLVGRVVSAGVIYLAATVTGGAEPRPGRTGKVVVGGSVAVAVMALISLPELAPAAAAVGASAGALLPLDLRERASLGRLGGSALAAALAVVTIQMVGTGTEMLLALVLGALHALGRRPAIGSAAAARWPLARLDGLGRVPEAGPVTAARD